MWSKSIVVWLSVLMVLVCAGAYAQEPAAASPAERLSFNGYLNLEGDYQVTQEGKGDRNGSLDVDVLELLVNYKGSDKFRLSGAVDWEHGADTELARGELTLGWAFLEYEFSNALKLRAGKMLAPFGVYNEIHGAKSLFLSRTEPRATLKPDKIAKNAFRFSPKWEAGVAALGDIQVGGRDLDWVVMIGTGDQIETNPYEEDNNTRKSTLARVQYEAIENLIIGVSAYQDTLTVATASTDGSLQSLGMHAKYDGSRWKALYEISRARLSQPGSTAAQREVGQVAELGYALDNGFIPYVQYQHLSTEKGALDEAASVYIGGFDYKLGHFVFKLEDALYKGSRSNAKFPFKGNQYNQVQMALFYAF